MGSYILSRFGNAVILIVLISFFTFGLIQLPPSDMVESEINQLMVETTIPEEQRLQLIADLRAQYDLDKPFMVRYFRWFGRIVFQGNFGYSPSQSRSVNAILRTRFPLSALLAFITLFGFTFGIGIPIGIYSAVRSNTIGDRVVTFLGFIGRATPNFLLALVLMILFFNWFGIPIGSLQSMRFQAAPFSLAKFIDFLLHLIVPVIVIGTSATAGIIRTLRATLLDELGKDYVRVARSKGIPERAVLKYPIRIALNPVLANIGWALPNLIGGMTLTAIVMNLPILGPALYQALLAQDLYLAGGIFFILSSMTVVGTLLSDILLVVFDPRISYEGKRV